MTLATEFLYGLEGHKFDLLTLSKPVSPEAALNLANVVSKLSPLLGNLIEFNTVEFLNDRKEFKRWGHWKRQDPDFPDAIFEGTVLPKPGMEIKAWFPLATEITARFRESQNHFTHSRAATEVCILAWLPDQLIYGKPYILDVTVVNGLSVAQARDNHYHNPPDYLVIEPENTEERTRNLQQTNTTGHKFQGKPGEFEKASKIVESWGKAAKKYKPTAAYQRQLRELTSKFKYRLDTNYAKMDRIAHPQIEEFKEKVCCTEVNGMTIGSWLKLFSSVKARKPNPLHTNKQLEEIARRRKKNEKKLKVALSDHIQITEEDAARLLV